MAADTSTVTWVSMTVRKARANPESMAARTVFPDRSSSRILSKIRILVSTAMPMVSTTPAIPGRVRVAWKPAMAASRTRRLRASATSDGVGAERGADRSLLENLHGSGERAGLEHDLEIARLLEGEAAGDLRLA